MLEVDAAKALGKTIKLRRIELDLTQEGLGERCEFDRSFVSQIERGVKEPSLKHLRIIAKGLETTPAALLTILEETWGINADTKLYIFDKKVDYIISEGKEK